MSESPPGVTIRDDSADGFGWIADSPAWMERASHALAAGGGVWLVDPVDFSGLDERVVSLGSPRAVIQLLEWHARDCAAIAARLGVPHFVVPQTVPESPFEAFPIRGVPRWKEAGLWWEERRTLVVAEAVGTVRYYCAPGRRLGVHPLLRVFRPPTVLLGYEAERLLVGHGAGLHYDVPAALEEAVRRSRRDFPRIVPRILGAKRAA